MKEKFVRINTIEGYEDVKDCYWISNSDEDKVINRNTGKILKVGFDTCGYKKVSLWAKDRKKKICYLHVLKAKAFLFGPNPLDYNIVRHLNDVKIDNRLENLAFGTQSDNNLDCIRNGKFNYEASAKNFAKCRAINRANGGSIKGGKVGGKINGRINGKKASKPVKCIETGIIYSSTHEAGRKTGINHGNISNCCRGRCKTVSGYHWQYVSGQYINKENDQKE